MKKLSGLACEDRFIPAKRAEYETRCEHLTGCIYRLQHNTHGDPGSVVADMMLRDFYRDLAKAYAPAAQEAVHWLKKLTPVWDNLIVAFAAEREGTSGVTIPYLHAVEIDVAQVFEKPRFQDFCLSLAHEFGHVAQHMSGRFCDYTWEGRPMASFMSKSDGFNEYSNLPWEKDARAFAHAHGADLQAHLEAKGLKPPVMPTIREAIQARLHEPISDPERGARG